MGEGDLNEEPHFFKGYNGEIAKIHWKHLKIFSRTIGPILISAKLGTMHPLVMKIQVSTNEGSHSFPRGYNNNFQPI